MARSTLPFFAATFAFTWLLQLPAVLALHGVISGSPERFMALVGLGALGPLAAATLAARLEGKGRVGALFGQLRIWRVSPIWYVVALALPGALLFAATKVHSLFGGQERWFYPPDEAPRLIAMIFFPFGEEIGWRGFALPRLQARFGPLPASLIVGVAWCAWHAPMFDLSGLSIAFLVGLTPFFVAGSVVFTWLWNRTGGSLLLAVLAHVGAHLCNSHRALPANPTPAILHAIAYVVFALALVALDRRAFSNSTPR